MQIGVRIGRPILPWLTPELELSFAPTDTTAVGGAEAASVFWMEPRLHVRFELMPGERLQPFFLLGGCAPVVLSSEQTNAAPAGRAKGKVAGDGEE
jgi:hypothetical protein